MLISVHIPKCGGISFEHVLRRIYGKKQVWLNYGAAFDQEHARTDLIPPRTQCIHGHFLSDAFDHVVPQPQVVTWFRHPVERVVSNYHHFFRHPDPNNPCCRELLEKKLSLEEFAELELMRNEATRYLAGKPLKAFAFIGITERFSESLRAFGATLGLPVPGSVPCENVNPHRMMDSYPLSDHTYEHILKLNFRDLMAYDQAAARLDGRIARSVA